MLAPLNAEYVRTLYARDAALHAAHCKNDVSFVRYGPVTGPKKGPRSEWGSSERRAYGRLPRENAYQAPARSNYRSRRSRSQPSLPPPAAPTKRNDN